MGLDQLLDSLPRALADISKRLERIEHEQRELRRQMPPQLLTVAQAAKAQGISKATMWRRIREKEIPKIQHGRTVRIDARHLHGMAAAEVSELVADALKGRF